MVRVGIFLFYFMIKYFTEDFERMIFMMTRFNDEIFKDDFTGLFDKVLSFDKYYGPFQQNNRDRSIYWTKNHADHQTVVIGCLGVSEDDIDVVHGYDPETNQSYISTSGETTDEDTGNKFTANYRFWIDQKKIQEVTWKLSNGLLRIQLWYKEDEHINIPVKKVQTGIGID